MRLLRSLAVVLVLALPVGARAQRCGVADPAVQFWWVANHGGAVNLPAAAPGAGWWSYVDPIAPTLSFLAPPGWRVTSLSTDLSHTGFLLLRDDGRAAFRTSFTNLPADWIAPDAARAYLEDLVGGEVQVLCLNAFPLGDPFGSIRAVLVARTSYGMAVAVAQTFVVAGFVRADLRAVVAPETEFIAVTQTVFLPVATQLLLPADGDRDRDGDGVTNDADAFPDDPQRR